MATGSEFTEIREVWKELKDIFKEEEKENGR